MYLKVIEMDICVVRHNLCFVIFLDEKFEVCGVCQRMGGSIGRGTTLTLNC